MDARPATLASGRGGGTLVAGTADRFVSAASPRNPGGIPRIPAIAPVHTPSSAASAVVDKSAASKDKPKDKPKPPKGDDPPPPAPPEAPGAVTQIACISGDMEDIVTFEPPASGGPVASYVLSRSVAENGPYSSVATLTAEARSFAFTVAETGTSFYTVSTSGPGGDGPASAPVTNDRVLMSALVPLEGATFASSNGEVILAIPAGAYSSPTTVTVTEISATPVGALISLSGIYDITPDGPVAVPATLSVRYTLGVTHFQVIAAVLASAELMTFDEATGTWVEGAVNVRAEGGYLSGELAHFSVWHASATSPHGTAETTYCSDGSVCHNLSSYPDSATRIAARSSAVCYHCHGAALSTLPPLGATGPNVQAQFFDSPDQVRTGAETTHPVATGDLYCTVCHDPHADSATSPGLLKSWSPVTGIYVTGGGGTGPGDAFCWTCHGAIKNRRTDYLVPGYYTRTSGDKQVAYSTSAHARIPSTAGSTCQRCHAEHGSTSGSLLNASYGKSTPASVDSDRATGAYAQACLQCHDGGSWLAQGAANIKQYVTYDAANTGAMSYGGHRVLSAGGTLPVNAPLPCTACHGPHGSLRNNKLLLSDALGADFDTSAGATAVRRFCFSCHTTSEGNGWDSATGTYVPVGTTALVEGLRRDGGELGSGPGGAGYNWLRLKVTAGHAQADADSCYLCHGNSYGTAASRNVHNPDSYSVAIHTSTPTNGNIAIKGKTYGPYACSTCHNLELRPEHEKARSSTAGDTCKACHASPRNSLTPSWDRNTCAQGNCHAGTSADPMHGTIDADHTTTGPCSSANCHSQDAAATHDTATGGPGCAACHGPGITPTLSCGACHPSPHPNSAVATPAVNHGPAADQCTSCHSSANIMDVHGDNCARCHPTPAGPTAVYAGGCSQAGCHPGPRVHASDHISADHGEGPDCAGCHSLSPNDCGGCHAPIYERGIPVTTSDARANYSTVAYILLNATDVGDRGYAAGIKATYYQIDSGPIQTGNTVLVGGPATGARSHSIEFWSIDTLYNVEAHKVAYFTVWAPKTPDTNPPTGSMAVNNGALWTNTTAATLNSSVVDAETVVVSMRVDPGTGVYGAWIPYVTSYPITLPAGTAPKTVRAEYRDYAGNLVMLSDGILIDITRPAGTMQVGNGSGYANTLFPTITSALTDSQSGMAWMRIQGGTWVPYSATAAATLLNAIGTNQRVWVDYADAAWNVTTLSTYVRYDPLILTGTMSVNNGATYSVSQSVTMNSAITDTGGSGVSKMRVDPGTGTFGAWIAYAGSYPLTLPAGLGLKTVRAEYTDLAGNVLSKSWSITLVGAGGDITPPTGSISINSGLATTQVVTVNLTLSGADTGGSGLSSMRLSNDNSAWGPWLTYSTTYTGWALPSGDGLKTVYVQYRDFEGNTSSSYLDTIWLDGTPPTGSLVINNGAAYTISRNVMLTMPVTDAPGGAPGLMQVRYMNEGGNWSGWGTYFPSNAWALSLAQGTKTVRVEYRDFAGNVSTTATDSIIYDVTAPTGSVVINDNAASTNSPAVMLKLTAVDTAGAGMGEMCFSNDNVSWSTWEPYATTKAWGLAAGDGLKTVYVKYRDAALNAGIAYSDTITLDTTGSDTIAPTGTVSINGGASMTVSAAVTLTLSAADTGGSGIAQMRFSNDGATWSAWQLYATTRSWTLAAGGGAKTVYVQYKDNAGNASGSLTDDISLEPMGSGSGSTSLSIDSDTWVDADYGATGPWSTFSIYVNDVLVDTKSGTSGPTWACPTTILGPGGHIDIVVDCGFTLYSYIIEQMRPHTYTITLPADAVRLEATTWTGFPAQGTNSGWWDPYDDNYTGVFVPTGTIGNILYSVPGDPDTTPPTGSVTINGGANYTPSRTVTLATPALDTGGSALSQIRFSNDTINWTEWEPYAASKTWTLAPGDGAKTVYVQYNDNAGYASSTYADGITLDTAAPTGTITIDSGAAYTGNTSVALTLSASDAGSGLSQMRFSNDNVNWTPWETYGESRAWTLAAGSGTRNVYVQYKDGGGAVSASFSDSINLLASMTLNYSAGAGGTLSGAVTQSVLQGMSGTAVTAIPDAGQKFLGWSDIRTDNPRTDTNVWTNVATTAWFTPSANRVVRFYTDGNGYLQGGQWVQGVQTGSSSVSVTAQPYDSNAYNFSYWSDGVSIVYTPTLTLSNVTSDQSWTAYFTWTGTCPFLYTWDGDSFEFEADEFAAGYLGLRTSKGYRRPNPIDYHVLANTPVPKNGALEYQLVEERDETDYIDLAKLYTVDAPADRDVYIERSQAEGVGQFTTLEAVIHTVAKNLQAPPSVKWINTGQEVRDVVSASDGNYVMLNHDRNAGFNYQTLELDLGDVQNAPMVKLVIDGRTMVPTSPEGRAYSRTFGAQVKFEVQDTAGNWVAVPLTTEILPKPPEFDRPFVMDLTNIWVSDSRKVRFTYLYKTYIDSILLDTTADVPVTITELPLQSAELQQHGFNFKFGTGELFEYVYGDPFQGARYKLPGNYTKLGDVTPLLREVDDKFIIFGGGDQITMRFTPPSSPWSGTRRYLFFSNGYYKTLKEDISKTVEPLPFAAMSTFPYEAPEEYPTDAEHRAYLREWNTRYESGE